MARQIGPDFGSVSAAALEQRILQLETEVALLAHAVRTLAHELDERVPPKTERAVPSQPSATTD